MIITAGRFKGQKITAPDENITRPTLSKVRMSVFNTLFSLIGDFDGRSFLDMFGGSGIMGLEALSRGFEKVRVFEKNRTVADIIKSNYKTLGLEPDIYTGDSLNLIKKQTEAFDVIYIDPPYESGIYENVLEHIKTCELMRNSVIVVEINSEIDFDGFEVIKQKKYGDKYISFIKTI